MLIILLTKELEAKVFCFNMAPKVADVYEPA